MTRAAYGRVGRWLCLGGASLGALGLFGWIAELAPLTTILQGEAPMMPNTAIGLLLVGWAGALRFPEHSRGARRVLSVVVGGLSLIIGVATLAEYAFSTNLRLDDLLTG